MSTVPTFLITSVSPAAADVTAFSLAMDLPNPVTVSHSFGENGQSLVRVVSDITGVIDRTTIDLEHACIPCAIREDIIPTLASLSDSGRWSSIVARLPVGAEAVQVGRVAQYAPEQLGSVKINGIINAIDGCNADESLTSPELLCEQPLHTFAGDDRGVAEVASSLLEYSDIIAVDGELTAKCQAFMTRLARPGVRLIQPWSEFDGSSLLPGVHDPQAIEEWVNEVPRDDITEECTDGVWRMRLRSNRAMHPERIQENLPELASGIFRARGCFWVPTRPQSLCVWDGASGQLNIGTMGRWHATAGRGTDIVVTGLLEHGDPRNEIRTAFEKALCRPDELDSLTSLWATNEDGLEPWLGYMEEV